ncbi:MAG: 30S ribosomal protein S17 [Epsilonproteobacteria bacterium]|nr:30S ribosomal protein S17 [Campylobacterota bacterium]
MENNIKHDVDQAQTSKGLVLAGEVVSDKMDKTVVVRVLSTFTHPLYGKIVRRYKKYKVHDEQNQARVGDKVEMVKTKPFSKTKHMKLVKIVENAA